MTIRSTFQNETMNNNFHIASQVLAKMNNREATNCMPCPNYESCNKLNEIKTALNARHHNPNEEISVRNTKSVRIFLDHLQRQKLNFPLVKNFSKCWYHNKYGVIENLIVYGLKLFTEKKVA